MNFILDWALPLLVGSGAATGTLIFLSKQLIAQQLGKDMAEFKTQLTEKTDALKHKLSIFAHERNVQATRIDSQKSEAIQDVYRSIANLLKHADKFANDAPHPVSSFEESEGHDTQKAREFRFYKENAELIKNSSLSLSSVLLDNAIFIDSSTYKKIEIMQSRFLSLSNDYLAPIIEEQCTRDDIELVVDEQLDYRQNLADYYNEELLSIKEQIISTFRYQLGVKKT